MIEQTEDAILVALDAAFPNLNTGRFDKDLDEFSLRHGKAAIQVVLRQAPYGDSPVLSGTYRPILPEFGVASFTRGLRGNPGAYEVIQGIDDALRGVEVEGTGDHPGGQLKLQRTTFLNSRPGPVWVFGQDVALTMDT
jgi:hypothetical protein